jgi:hypothetical protein
VGINDASPLLSAWAHFEGVLERVAAEEGSGRQTVCQSEFLGDASTSRVDSCSPASCFVCFCWNSVLAVGSLLCTLSFPLCAAFFLAFGFALGFEFLNSPPSCPVLSSSSSSSFFFFLSRTRAMTIPIHTHIHIDRSIDRSIIRHEHGYIHVRGELHASFFLPSSSLPPPLLLSFTVSFLLFSCVP